MPQEFQNASGLRSRLLHATADFVSLPSVSPLAPGHLLVLPRRHVSSLLQLPLLADELVALVATLRRQLEARFGPTVLFEHGVGVGSAGGCGVDHAHLHIIPLARTVAANVRSTTIAEFGHAPNNTLTSLLANHDAGTSYLFLGHSLDSLEFWSSEKIPSQFVRRVIATATHKQHWNWREHFGWDEFIETWEAFDPASPLYITP